MAQLIVISAPRPDLENKTFMLVNEESLGSNPSNSIVLDSPLVESHHLKIKLLDSNAHISAFSESIDFSVNGSAVEDNAKLHHGDIVTVGDFVFLFDDQEDVSDSSKTGEESNDAFIDAIIESRIGSRQTPYDNAHHIIESFKDQTTYDKKLVTLYRISNAISGILDLDQLLRKFLEIILDEFSADRGFIMLFDKGRQKMVPAVVIVKNEQISQSPKISQTIMDEVISTKQSLLCENTMEDPRIKAESMIRHNIMSAMCVPLIRNEEILGLIQVDSYRRNHFSSKDLDFLTKATLQAAMVIENASFYKEREEFGHNLLSLSHATQGLSSYLRQESIIEDACLYASRIFGCQKSYLFLQEEGKISLSHAIGATKEEQKEMSIPASFVKVMKDRKPLLGQGKNIPEDLKGWIKEKYLGSSFVIVPITTSNEKDDDNKPAIGAICVSDKKNRGRFTTEDLRLISILASYTAIALTNSKFYRELKNKEEEIAQWNAELEKRVTERTEKLKSIQSQLIQSEKMATVGLLAAGVAHEFNNIIASMYGFAQIAQVNEKYKDKLVDTVINQCRRASTITESLLSFSKQRDADEQVNIVDVVENVLRFTTGALENEGIKVVKNFNPVPETVANPNKIQQVFENIIINAWHAIEQFGTITITISLQDQNWIHINFQDSGKGIDSENLQKIFDPFWTTKGSFGGGTQPGTGMGLYACYHIMKEHGGKILVESEIDKGTTFTIVLPVRTLPQTQKIPKMLRDRSSPSLQTQKILVVEDEENIRKLLKHVLREKGFDVEVVDDGMKAVELARQYKFHLIFLDVKMPGEINGFGVFDEIKKIDAEARIVLVTGRAEDSTLMSYVGKADGYLRKPFNIDDIYRIIGCE